MALDVNTRHQLDNTCYHEHSIIVYADLNALREIYCRYSKEALEKNNEIVLIATTYETPQTVRDMLSDYSIDVPKHELDGSLVIIDSVRGYQSTDVYGVLKLIKSMAARAQKQGKSGVFNISDMGSFFVADRQKDLLTYELSIPKELDMEIKGFCCYHKKDFELKLSKEDQATLLNHHSRSIIATTFLNERSSVSYGEAA